MKALVVNRGFPVLGHHNIVIQISKSVNLSDQASSAKSHRVSEYQATYEHIGVCPSFWWIHVGRSGVTIHEFTKIPFFPFLSAT